MSSSSVTPRERARIIAGHWLSLAAHGPIREESFSQSYWRDILHGLMGIADLDHLWRPEHPVRIPGRPNPGKIDIYLPDKRIVIEHKSSDVDLDRPQPGHDGLTPFEQAKLYADNLITKRRGHEVRERVSYVVVSNFTEIRIHQLHTQEGDELAHPEQYQAIALADLPEQWPRLSFLADLSQAHTEAQLAVSVRACSLISDIYDLLQAQYLDPQSPAALRSLNILCTRLVFCLYAEDSGLFRRDQFYHYLQGCPPMEARGALRELFAVLDTPPEKRDPYLGPRLGDFPYVNGGLFAEREIEIPNFTSEILELLLEQASWHTDWSGIDPTIFGALFESTLNPQTRRQGGMHYTSIANIERLTGPLFLDELRAQLQTLEEDILRRQRQLDASGGRGRVPLLQRHREQLLQLQERLGALSFLDPACGSGNFLTQTYISLRRLENRILLLLSGEAEDFFAALSVRVRLEHFHGFEINDFAVSVARTALWIAEAQLLAELNDRLHQRHELLPLTSSAPIHEVNALTADWAQLAPPEDIDYVIGNPPFGGGADRGPGAEALAAQLLPSGLQDRSGRLLHGVVHQGR